MVEAVCVHMCLCVEDEHVVLDLPYIYCSEIELAIRLSYLHCFRNKITGILDIVQHDLCSRIICICFKRLILVFCEAFSA